MLSKEADALRAVVAHLPSVQGSPRRGRMWLVVNQAVERLTGGNSMPFSHLVDLSRNIVENWCQGKRIPEMDMLLRLCYRLNLSLDEVLFQEQKCSSQTFKLPSQKLASTVENELSLTGSESFSCWRSSEQRRRSPSVIARGGSAVGLSADDLVQDQSSCLSRNC